MRQGDYSEVKMGKKQLEKLKKGANLKKADLSVANLYGAKWLIVSFLWRLICKKII